MELKEAPQLQELSTIQKINFIRRKLEFIDPKDVSEASLGKNVVWINLLYPAEAPWGEIGKKRIPPQKGKFNGFVNDRRTGKPHEIIVDFTTTTAITGVQYALFPISSLDIGIDSEVYVDCRRLAAVQSEIPNIFGILEENK
ncbi:hypothetical protein HYV21_01875 [Candidatus Microgenomates bacterium]|nr:hypothetical protein [Candidatus Microgenomates bacterium]